MSMCAPRSASVHMCVCVCLGDGMLKLCDNKFNFKHFNGSAMVLSNCWSDCCVSDLEMLQFMIGHMYACVYLCVCVHTCECACVCVCTHTCVHEELAFFL